MCRYIEELLKKVEARRLGSPPKSVNFTSMSQLRDLPDSTTDEEFRNEILEDLNKICDCRCIDCCACDISMDTVSEELPVDLNMGYFRADSTLEELSTDLNMVTTLEDLPSDFNMDYFRTDATLEELPADLNMDCFKMDTISEELPFGLNMDISSEELPVNLNMDTTLEELPVNMNRDAILKELPVDLNVDTTSEEMPVASQKTSKRYVPVFQYYYKYSNVDVVRFLRYL